MPKATTPRRFVGAKSTTSSKSLHVIPRANRWAVITEGGSRISKTFDTQTEAIEEARKLAKDAAGQLVIHGRTGRIRERDSYSRDPSPPREPRKVLHPSAPPRTTKRRNIDRAITQADRAARS
jgi:hypothetical protein